MTWWRTSEFGDKFTVGQSYNCDKARIRKSGFHACLNPWHILDYYTPYEGRFFRVVMDGQIDSCDHMLAATQMTVDKELTCHEIIECLIEHRDFRVENYDAVLSEKTGDSIYGEHHGLVVKSTGEGAFILANSECLWVLSLGDNARIIAGDWCINNLIVSYGENAYIQCKSSSRIEVRGENAVEELTGRNHALNLCNGTTVQYADKEWVAGVDFEAGRYYLTDGRKLVQMANEKGFERENPLFD